MLSRSSGAARLNGKPLDGGPSSSSSEENLVSCYTTIEVCVILITS
jgi:hypothetical protein